MVLGLDGSHFPISCVDLYTISLNKTFFQCVVLARLVAFIA